MLSIVFDPDGQSALPERGRHAGPNRLTTRHDGDCSGAQGSAQGTSAQMGTATARATVTGIDRSGGWVGLDQRSGAAPRTSRHVSGA